MSSMTPSNDLADVTHDGTVVFGVHYEVPHVLYSVGTWYKYHNIIIIHCAWQHIFSFEHVMPTCIRISYTLIISGYENARVQHI